MAKSKRDGSKSKQESNASKDDWFDSLNPNKMMNNAQRILSSAVNVLEEEIAAGILAAKKLEKKVIDVDEVRSNPEELMSRIRRDTHEAVDIFLDALTAITHQLGILSNGIQKETATASSTNPPSKTSSDHSIPIVVSESPTVPGKTAEVHLTLSNDHSEDSIKVVLIKTDLVGGLAHKILARHIQLVPPLLTLKPGEEKAIVIKIKVPKSCFPGHYCGLFIDELDSSIRTVIGIDVI